LTLSKTGFDQSEHDSLQTKPGHRHSAKDSTCRKASTAESLNLTNFFMRASDPIQRVLINGIRWLALRKKQIIALSGSVKLVDKMPWATRHANEHWFTS